MDYEIVELSETRIIGPTITTANDAPDVAQVISNLWQRFMEGHMDKNVPDAIVSPYICFGAYYNYDMAGNTYTMMVGCESRAHCAPEEMDVIIVPAGKYAKFSVRGDHVQTVIDAWNEIWAMETLTAQRAYTVDFEAYHPAENMDDAATDLYIALR